VADDAHTLQVCVELEPAVDLPLVSSLAVEPEDHVRISVRLVEDESTEEECLDFHGVTD
jgi:hypothetical protein